ncbi:TPM domain-containing protein [Methylobacterium sp. A54F]
MTGGVLRRCFVLLILLGVAGGAAAELALPALTGRVVDGAGLLDAATRERLDAKLKAYEDKTSDQVVVATVKSLQGTTVEDFANRLFRAWGLGSRKNDNGVLLLVAPSERKVRIEVGYGLEGALTDALSKVIITTAIAPRFKSGDYGGGIEAGLDAILSILGGDAETWHRRAEVRNDEADPAQVIATLLVFIVIVFVFWRMSGGRRGRRGGVIVLPGSFGGGWSGGVSGGYGGGSGGFSDSGFSGGGGSSGGGGASGDW